MRKLKKPLSILLSLIMVLGVFTIVPFSVSAETTIVEYVEREWDADSQKVIEEDKTLTGYTPLTKNTTSPDSGTYVLDSDVTFSSRMVIGNGKDVRIILCNGFTLTNKKGINVKKGGKLTFYGQHGDSGNVDVYNDDGAGIGAMDEEEAGTIIFKGGHIVAKGGNKDAGIGSGKNSDSGFEEITFIGGKIKAYGGEMGAGIGAGRNNDCADCKKINIYGGNIDALGGNYGAGIGGGEDSSVKEINIYGGNVNARGFKEASGIGSGNDEDNDGTINIYGGTVTANAGEDGAGIGGGDDGNGGTINIFNGKITAKGDRDGAGIGGGDDGDGGKITINGGEINCWGNDGAGIGGGCDGKEGNIEINGGTVKALSGRGAGIGGGCEENTRGSMKINGGLIFAISGAGAGIGSGVHGDLETELYITDGNIYALSGIKTNKVAFSEVTEETIYLLPEYDLGHTGAGIGGGAEGSQDSTVHIEGGVVHAIGGAASYFSRYGHGGAGIGGGSEHYSSGVSVVDWFISDASDGGESSDVEIKDGATVIACGGSGACAIGYGDSGDELGDLSIPQFYSVFDFHKDDVEPDDVIKTIKKIKAVRDKSELLAIIEEISQLGEFAKADKRVEACRKEDQLVVIKSCKHIGRTYDIAEDTHTIHCKHCGYEATEPHRYNNNLCECSLVENALQHTLVRLTDPVSARAFDCIVDSNYELPEGRNSEPDSKGMVKKFTGWTRNDQTYQPGEIVTVERDMSFGHTYEKNYLVNYADDMTNGHLTADVSMAPEGATVTVKAHPDANYQLKRIWYIREDHGVGTLWDLEHEEGSSEYTITMPASKITLHAEFEKRNDIHNHGNMTFEPYPGAENVGNDGGVFNYYLTEDSAAPDYINTSATVNICLNGHELIIPENGLSVYPGGELKIHDCSYVTDIIVNDDGTQEVIKDESKTKGVISGGRITVMGAMDMYGGNITGSQGVCVNGSPGVFNMYGGKIEGNSSSTHGAGVYVAHGEAPNIFNIRGDVSIRNNTYTGGGGAVEENVYLEQSAEIKIVADEPLTDATKIGVTSADNRIPVEITSELGEKATADNFFSDNDDYFVEVNRGDRAQLQALHTLSFDSNGGTGTMETETVRNYFYYLPGCGFDAPAGMVFAGWKIGDAVYKAGDQVTLTQNDTAVAQWMTAGWDIWINGKNINSENMNDIFGDGTASYDNATNTLTLNNATIEAQKFNSSVSAGIRYSELSSEPFNIVLNGTNKIVNETPDDGVFFTYGLEMFDSAPSYKISGSGTLDIEFDADDDEIHYYGIMTENPLAIDGTSVNVDIPGTAGTYSVYLMFRKASLTLKNSANVAIKTGSNESTYSLSGNNSEENLIVEDEGSKLTAESGNKAISNNITLSDRTKARGAYVKAQPDGGLGVWDGTTPLTEFSSVSIPGENTFGAHLVGHSISLDGDIAVNFYMELSDSVVNGNNDPYMLFNIPDTSKEYKEQKVYLKTKEGEQRTVAKEVSDIATDKTYYMFKCRVAAKDMESEITAQMFDGENEKGGVYTYSVKQYADYLMDNAYTDDTHETVKNQTYADAYGLVDAMLTYGDQAKTYFDDTAVDVELNPVTNSISNNGYDTPIDVSVFDGATLSLKSQTTLSLYFKSDKALTLSINGKTEGVDYELKNADDEYVIRIRNIAVKELDQPITVNVSYEGYSGTVSYSPLRYCYLAANSESTGNKLKNAVNALYNYYLAAKAYFSDNNSQSGGGE